MNVKNPLDERTPCVLCVPRFMRDITSFLLATVLLALFAGSGWAQSAPGSIEGRVFNAHEGSALANARVILEGTGAETLTDESGSSRFSGVRPGQARLVVSYLGLEGQTASIDVRSGEAARHEFQLQRADAKRGAAGEVLTLSAYNVVVEREASAQAMAVNDQRHAANIKNVVALDEFGDRKGSIGQFLAFLPGVSLNFAGSNPTEVSLRGFPGGFTNFSVDGAQMSSTFTEGRGQRLEEVSSVNISRVEVTKAPTPDLPASGLGGSINLISRSGFESKTRRITYDVYGMFHSWRGITFDGASKGDASATSPSYVQPSLELTMVQPFGNNLAVTLDASDRDNRAANMTWDFRPNGSTDAIARQARNFDVFDDVHNAGGPTLFGRRVQWFSGRKFYELSRQRPDWFVLNESLAHQNRVNTSREMKEAVSAGYVRGDLRLLDNRLWLVTGVCYERTEVEGRGPANDSNALYQRNAAGNFVLTSNGQRVLITTDPLAQARLRFQERASYAKNDYDGFHPSLNATYSLTDKLLLRGAYARTVGRPQTSNIIPGTTITAPDVANPTITVSNTGLLPWTADSYDLSLESYQIKDGVGSVGVFYKKIRNFFGNVRGPATPDTLAEHGLPNDPLFQGYDLVTLLNTGDATVRGMEFAYRQSLTFLPGWARGLQAFVNATRLEVDDSNSADFTGFNPSTYAAGLSLTRPRYFVKVTYNYQGEIRTGTVAANAANGIPPNTGNYQAAKKRLGVSAQYSFSKRYAVYLSIVDLTGFEQDLRRYAPDTPDYAKSSRLQELGYFTTIGIRGTF